MRLGLDTRPIVTSKGRGIGNYAIQLYEALVKIVDWDIILYSYEGVSVKTFSLELRDANEVVYEGDFESTITEFCKDYKVDVFYTPNALEDTRIPLNKEMLLNTVLVGTVHDIIPYIMKKQYFINGKVPCDLMKRYNSLSGFDLIFSNSMTTQNDLQTFLKLQDVCNIYMSGKKRLANDKEIENIYRDLRRKYRLSNNYFISIAGAGINKNIEGLVKSYKKYACANNRTRQLVIVFKMSDFTYNNLKYYLFKHNLKNVVLINAPTEEELIALLRHSSWLIAVSHYEGFGMPVVEAWSENIPVMCSNNSSLGEISKDVAVHVNPGDINSIAEGYQMIDTMSIEQREEYIRKGVEKSKFFTWENTATKFANQVEYIFERNLKC